MGDDIRIGIRTGFDVIDPDPYIGVGGSGGLEGKKDLLSGYLIMEKDRCCTLYDLQIKKLCGPVFTQCKRCGTKEDIAREDAEIENMANNLCAELTSGLKLCVKIDCTSHTSHMLMEPGIDILSLIKKL